MSILEDFNFPICIEAPGSLACPLHMFLPLFFPEDRLCDFAWANSRIFFLVGKDFEDRLFDFSIEFVWLRSAASKGAITDLMPAIRPLLTPLDRSSACLANFIRNHRDLRFWGRG